MSKCVRCGKDTTNSTCNHTDELCCDCYEETSREECENED